MQLLRKEVGLAYRSNARSPHAMATKVVWGAPVLATTKILIEARRCAAGVPIGVSVEGQALVLVALLLPGESHSEGGHCGRECSGEEHTCR